MNNKSPIAFIIFNRPDLTSRVFSTIRNLRPNKLLIIADGPRHGRLDDIPKCNEARKIVDNIDWPCEVMHNYSESNLGCGKRISSGLNWVFQQVEEAIILEDDCLPHPSFFRFCDELLAKYRDDERVMHISGNCFVQKFVEFDSSYSFSRFSHIWGWATWRRAWKSYEFDLKSWGNPIQRGTLKQFLSSEIETKYVSYLANSIINGKIDTWDYQWSLCILRHKGLCIYPSVNMVYNLGFRNDATHTVGNISDYPWADNPSVDIGCINHPNEIRFNKSIDDATLEHIFDVKQILRQKTLRFRMINLLKTILSMANK